MAENGKRSTGEIEREIERARANLVHDVEALQVVVRDKLDWRRPIRERPLALCGGALAAGFILGLL